ncbi:MAG: hypothetical protein OXB88_01795 [Bacteriovoracales bacterium]|nr:hypothetical protein [Bacteriovoracales bacterium]
MMPSVRRFGLAQKSGEIVIEVEEKGQEKRGFVLGERPRVRVRKCEISADFYFLNELK